MELSFETLVILAMLLWGLRMLYVEVKRRSEEPEKPETIRELMPTTSWRPPRRNEPPSK